MNRRRLTSILAALLCLAALSFSVGCSSDKGPTAPPDSSGGPPTGGGGGGGGSSSSLVITLTANPTSLRPNDSTFTDRNSENSVITVCVANSSGTAVPDGSSVTLETSLGTFTTAFFGPQTVGLELSGGCAQVRLFAPEVEGTAIVVAKIGGASKTVEVTINESASILFVNSVIPNSGPPSGGTRVEISGGGFDAPVKVEFFKRGSSSVESTARVLSVEPTLIVIETSPITLADPTEDMLMDIVVTNLDPDFFETAEARLDSAFTYTASETIPQIFSISPSSGPNDGGTRVTIFGQGFQFPIQVFFGTAASNRVEAQVVSVTSNQIVAITPAAFGLGYDLRGASTFVQVINPLNGQTSQVVDLFRYGPSVQITDVIPDRGDWPGGNLVTIYGQGFDEPLSVTWCLACKCDCVQQQVISVTATEIVIRTAAPVTEGCESPSGFFTVTLIDNGDKATATEGFIFEVFDLLLTGISPSQGRAGTVVTLSGFGFTSPMRVTFGNDSQASATVLSSTTATAIVPNVPLGTEACGTSGTRFASTIVDVTVTALATGCEDTLTGAFTVLPPSSNPCIGDAPPVCTAVTLAVVPTPTAGVDGTNFSFSATASGGTTFTYSWAFFVNGTADGTAIGATAFKTFTGTALTAGNDTGTAQVTATNECGNTATTSAAVTICPSAIPCP